MQCRIFSQVVRPSSRYAAAATLAFLFASQASAQDNTGLYTDEATGIIYRKVNKTIERPVEETRVETREQTVYRPQKVTETRPESRTVYTPTVQYYWEPRVHGRWNPFRQPTVAYHHVPRMQWEAQNQVVQRTSTRTEWVAEKRTIDVPHRIVRMEREQKVDYEPVGRVAPQTPPGPQSALASRLRPLDANERVQPFGTSGTRIASSTVSTIGRMTSDPPRRTTGQSGLPATTLAPGGKVYGQPLPPVTTGVATLPMPTFR